MKLTYVIIAFIILLLSCKSAKEDLLVGQGNPYPFNGPGISRKQVVDIAAKYGLEDSIAYGYTSVTFKPFPEEAYPYLSEEYFEGFFSRWRKYADALKDIEEKKFDMKKINTVSDYFEWIERSPDRIKEYEAYYPGGLSSFKQDVIKGLLSIYISDDGAKVTTTPDGDQNRSHFGRKLSRQ